MNYKESYPDDLIVEILLRSPLNPVLRFRATSKYWSSLVSSTFFAKLHLKQSICDGKQKLFLSTRTVFSSLDYEKTSDLLNSSKIQIPFKISRDFRILGSCNGLVCISTGSCKTIVIWNPYTTEFLKLPLLRYKDNSCITRYGFGYDPKTDDYKIFVVTIVDENENKKKVSQPVLNLFSLRKRAWRHIKDTKQIYCSLNDAYRFGHEAIYWDGALHWIDGTWDGTLHWIDGTSEDRLNENGLFLVSLNLHNDTFKKTLVPESKHHEYPTLGVLRNSLYISALVPGPFVSAYLNTSSWLLRCCGEGSTSNKVYVSAAYDSHPRIGVTWGSLPLSLSTRHGIILRYDRGLVTIKGPTNDLRLFHYGPSLKTAVYTESLISLEDFCRVENKQKRKRE